MVEGELIGDSFILDKSQDIREFVSGLNKELKHWTGLELGGDIMESREKSTHYHNSEENRWR